MGFRARTMASSVISSFIPAHVLTLTQLHLELARYGDRSNCSTGLERGELPFFWHSPCPLIGKQQLERSSLLNGSDRHGVWSVFFLFFLFLPRFWHGLTSPWKVSSLFEREGGRNRYSLCGHARSMCWLIAFTIKTGSVDSSVSCDV